jgi:hypothetical protein
MSAGARRRRWWMAAPGLPAPLPLLSPPQAACFGARKAHLERVLLARRLVLDHVHPPSHAMPDDTLLFVEVPHARVWPIVNEPLSAGRGRGGRGFESEWGAGRWPPEPPAAGSDRGRAKTATAPRRALSATHLIPRFSLSRRGAVRSRWPLTAAAGAPAAPPPPAGAAASGTVASAVRAQNAPMVSPPPLAGLGHQGGHDSGRGRPAPAPRERKAAAMWASGGGGGGRGGGPASASPPWAPSPTPVPLEAGGALVVGTVRELPRPQPPQAPAPSTASTAASVAGASSHTPHTPATPAAARSAEMVGPAGVDAIAAATPPGGARPAAAATFWTKCATGSATPGNAYGGTFPA